MKILIATENNIKVEATKQAFNTYFSDIEINVVAIPSDVSDMPYCSEIEKGVNNRLIGLKKYAIEKKLDIDYYVAIESGIYNYFNTWMITSLVAIENKYGKVSVSTSGSYPIPSQYAIDIIKDGLGTTLTRVFKDEANGHPTEGIGYLSEGKILRQDLMKEAVLLALTRFIHQNW